MSINREQWLNLAVDKLRTELFLPVGETVPVVRVSIGFPKGSARKIIGQFWPCEAVNDNTAAVFISPTLEDPIRILDVLAHELVHSIVPSAGHGKAFKRIALAIGLTGKMTATVAGEELATRLNIMADELGPLPQSAINLGKSPTKKQGTRLIKVTCSDCGYIARTTRKFLDLTGAPLCACNSEPMKEGK